jgi:hypothetical protein
MVRPNGSVIGADNEERGPFIQQALSHARVTAPGAADIGCNVSIRGILDNRALHPVLALGVADGEGASGAGTETEQGVLQPGPMDVRA